MSYFKTMIGEALGRASMAWSERPIGTFDSGTCSELVDKLHNEHIALNKALEEKLRVATEALNWYVEISTNEYLPPLYEMQPGQPSGEPVPARYSKHSLSLTARDALKKLQQ